MSERSWTITKRAVIGLVLVGAALFSISRFRHAMNTGEEGVGVWFYDQSEQQLYSAPRDTIPPHKGVGGEAGDGARAMVVICRAEQNDPGKRRIAYLETHTPELRRVLEGVQAARTAGRVYQGEIPSPDSDFFQKNTLVRRVEETTWHDVGSSEAQTIMTEWRGWSCPDGSPPMVCTP